MHRAWDWGGGWSDAATWAAADAGAKGGESGVIHQGPVQGAGEIVSGGKKHNLDGMHSGGGDGEGGGADGGAQEVEWLRCFRADDKGALAAEHRMDDGSLLWLCGTHPYKTVRN